MNLNRSQWLSVYLWGLLIVGALFYFWFIPDPWKIAWTLAVGLSELLALALTNMLPLSPLVQYVDDMGSDRAEWWQGFRALAGVIVVEVFVFGTWSLIYWAPWWVAVPIMGGFSLFVYFHWTRPEVYDR